MGQELQKEDQLQICSAEAVATARILVNECYNVFDDLNASLDFKAPKNKVVAAWKQKVKSPLVEPQVELLKINLERLKSSLLVILNVLIFAEQFRNQQALPILKVQRELIRTLVEDKKASEAKLQRILSAIADLKITDGPSSHRASNATSAVTSMVALGASGTAFSEDLGSTARTASLQLSSALKAYEEEIRHQCALLRNVVDENSSHHYNVDYSLRDRMHCGVLGAHWDAWLSLRKLYGVQVLLQAFTKVPAVVSTSCSNMKRRSMSRSE